MDYAALGTGMKTLIRSLGVPVTITRDGATVLKDYAVYLSAVEANDTTSPLSNIAIVTTVKAVAYIGGKFSKPPQPGDTVTSKGRSYIVATCETYQPGAVMVGFKLELT